MNTGGFWDTVREARLTRVLAVYLSACFVILQVAELFTDRLGLPDWLFTGSFALLLVGLPIVVATALVQGIRASQSAVQPLVEVSPFAEEAPPGGPRRPRWLAGPARRWLTWRRATLGGVAAFTLLGLAVTTYMAMWVLGIGPVGSLVAAGVIEERERVLIADFENRAADPELAAAVTEAFRVDLAQSPTITVVEPGAVREVLTRMGRQGEAALSFPLAQEVAVREGIKAIVAGEVAAAGAGYVLSARLISAESGEMLAARRETASDLNGVIAAIDRLSKGLRERMGESLRSTRRNEPLERVTTGSLEALRKYSQAVRSVDLEGDYEKGAALLEEAVALDTAFAMAYRKLGTVLGNQGLQPERATEALTRAFHHRNRLTERERYLTLGTYYMSVTGERDRAITAYRTLLDSYPNDGVALNNLATQYYLLRDDVRAEEILLRAVALPAPTAQAHINLIDVQIALGKLDAAQQTLAQLTRRHPEHPAVHEKAAQIAVAHGDYAGAAAQILALRESRRSSPVWQARTSEMLALLALTRGRLAEAQRHGAEAYAAARQVMPGQELLAELRVAEGELQFRGARAQALQRIEAALRRYPLDSIPPLARPYGWLASLYAEAGRPERARAWLAQGEATASEGMKRNMESGLHLIRGQIALAEERAADALTHFRQADQIGCRVCVLPQLGRAYEAAREPDSAIAAYQRYVSTPDANRLMVDALWLALSLERLGQLHEARGNRQLAAANYARFADLWQDADAELQPRVREARRRAAALGGGTPG